MQILQRRVYQLISSSASSAQRLLSSDKLRKRKWVLPSFASEKPVRSETRTSPSKPTVKKPDIQQADAIHNPKLEPWALRRIAIKNKYPEGWRPVRRISPEAVDGIRVLHKQRPHFTILQLAEHFKISPEAIRRILKSKWRPSPEVQARRIERWNRRTQKIAAEAKENEYFRRVSTSLGQSDAPLTSNRKLDLAADIEQRVHMPKSTTRRPGSNTDSWQSKASQRGTRRQHGRREDMSHKK